MAAAIETIADVGYANASLARIAKRAGLSSTGLITYHFAGKDELIQEVVADVYTEMSQFMAERMRRPASSADALRTYLESTVEFIGTRRAKMKAFFDIFMHGGFHYDATAEQAVVSPIAAILSKGQNDGEFRDFDPTVMATVIQRAVDGLPFLMASTPDLDLDAYARELVTLFDLATQRSK